MASRNRCTYRETGGTEPGRLPLADQPAAYLTGGWSGGRVQGVQGVVGRAGRAGPVGGGPALDGELDDDRLPRRRLLVVVGAGGWRGGTHGVHLLSELREGVAGLGGWSRRYRPSTRRSVAGGTLKAVAAAFRPSRWARWAARLASRRPCWLSPAGSGLGVAVRRAVCRSVWVSPPQMPSRVGSARA